MILVDCVLIVYTNPCIVPEDGTGKEEALGQETGSGAETAPGVNPEEAG